MGLLAIEVGWWFYQRNQYQERLAPFAAPQGWTVGNLSCDADDGFNKQYHQGNPFCIGPFAFVTPDGPWGMSIPPTKTVLHRLNRRTDTTGQTVAWWNRSGSENNFPRGGYVTQPAIPISPISPWEPVDPMAIPLAPSPQVHPDPMPASPYPRIDPGPRSPTERSFRGPTRPVGDPIGDTEPLRRGRVRPWDRPADFIDIPLPRHVRPPLPPVDPDLRPTDRPRLKPRGEGLRRQPGAPPLPQPRVTIRPRPGVHSPRRPGRRVRERKVRMKSALSFVIVRALFEQLFEAADYIEAIYEALPRHTKDRAGCKKTEPVCMMGQIHKHYDLIDISEMINNLILNEGEDFIFGLLGRMSAVAAQRLGLSVGPGFGQGFIRAQGRLTAAEIERAKAQIIEFVAAETETFK